MLEFLFWKEVHQFHLADLGYDGFHDADEENDDHHYLHPENYHQARGRRAVQVVRLRVNQRDNS